MFSLFPGLHSKQWDGSAASHLWHNGKPGQTNDSGGGGGGKPSGGEAKKRWVIILKDKESNTQFFILNRSCFVIMKQDKSSPHFLRSQVGAS